MFLYLIQILSTAIAPTPIMTASVDTPVYTQGIVMEYSIWAKPEKTKLLSSSKSKNEINLVKTEKKSTIQQKIEQKITEKKITVTAQNNKPTRVIDLTQSDSYYTYDVDSKHNELSESEKLVANAELKNVLKDLWM